MSRRLPGIRFETKPREVPEVLPRMDVAAFVGFAASGPLHIPVPVEDPSQLAAIFGDDATIAWDAERGDWARAELLPAVRAFFRNGGRRCWVVRVADQTSAQPDSFPLSGLLEVALTPTGLNLKPALAWARSEGSWSDAVQVRTGLNVDGRQVLNIARGTRPSELQLQMALPPQEGELLRLRYADSGLTAFMAVEQVMTGSRSCSGRAVWFAPHQFPTDTSASPPHVTWQATWCVGLCQQSADVVSVAAIDAQTLRVRLDIALAEAPPRGTPLRLSDGSRTVWLIAGDATVTVDELESAQVEIAGLALMWLADPPALPTGALPICEKLTLQLRAGAAPPLATLVLDDLDFVPGAPNYWGALPTDVELFAGGLMLGTGDSNEARARRDRYASLWRAAASPRFPLAGSHPALSPDAIARGEAIRPEAPSAPALFTVPLAADSGLPDYFANSATPDRSALERDGLASFSRCLFLDESLADALTGQVMDRADGIRYLAPTTRALRGIHAVLALDEVTLVAVPDAVQRAWRPAPRHQPLPPTTLPAQPAPEWGNFLECSLRTVPPPVMQQPVVDAQGTVILRWTTVQAGDFVLEEATRADFSDASVAYAGAQTEHTIYGRSRGDYYYHVQLVEGINRSDWSNAVVASVEPDSGWQVAPLGGAAPAFDLLSIQRALLRMCAARGDMFALLSLPRHYRENEAIGHADKLRPSDAPVFRTGVSPLDIPLGFGEAAVLSFGAIYHPWLIGQDEDGSLRETPPDGAMCGTLSQRALARGAWIAPANERLNGLVALTPPFDPARRLDLQTAQINLVRQEPYGFVTLSSDTLSSDPDLLHINVRRLLQLLRRLALRLGTGFVFEPMNESFLRRVRRDAESALAYLFGLGAFAGVTPDRSYQVVFRSTPQDVDEGRFIVDLRVAPALPMEFLTVRLVQADGRTAVTEER